MGYKKCILGIGVVCLYLFPASECSARRVHKPPSFIEKLAQCVEDSSINEALNPRFFKENWEILNGGIRVNISNGSFLEIRKTEEEVIVQFFGKASTSEQEQVSLLRNNLNRRAIEFNTPVAFLDFSSADLSKEQISVYSILNMNDADFEIIVQDILEGGNGSGINSLPQDILKLVDSMALDFGLAVNYGLIETENFKLDLDRRLFIQALCSMRALAVDRFQAIEDGKLDAPVGERNKRVNLFEHLRDRFKFYINALSNSDGDMIYRVFCREYLMPFLENIAKGNN